MPVTPPELAIPSLRTISSVHDSHAFPKLLTKIDRNPRSASRGSPLPLSHYLPRWYVARLKSNRDRIFVRQLHKAKLITSRPLTTLCLLDPDPDLVVKSGNYKPVPAQRPLLPGIVFLHYAPTSPWHEVIQSSDHLFQLLPVQDQIELHRDLKNLHKTLNKMLQRIKNSHHAVQAQTPQEKTLQGLKKYQPGQIAYIIAPSRLAGLRCRIKETSPTPTGVGSVVVQFSVGELGVIEHVLPPECVSLQAPSVLTAPTGESE